MHTIGSDALNNGRFSHTCHWQQNFPSTLSLTLAICEAERGKAAVG
jgi:hypothetical protein